MSKSFTTRSGIPIQESYTAADLPADLSTQLSEAGKYPFTRGVQKNMYRGRLWTMRQYAGFGTAEESNQRYHYLLAQGTMGLRETEGCGANRALALRDPSLSDRLLASVSRSFLDVFQR